MGVLTETTMRMRDEMMAWRRIRVSLRSDLVRQTGERRNWVSALCAGFASDRAGAHRAWFGPTLSEGHAAERQQRRGLVEAAKASAQAEERHAAAPKADSWKHGPAKSVAAPAAQAPIAPIPRVERLPSKKSKKR
jgi:hypothetical protein